jgi:hypothetical protein
MADDQWPMEEDGDGLILLTTVRVGAAKNGVFWGRLRVFWAKTGAFSGRMTLFCFSCERVALFCGGVGMGHKL